jgi:Na+/H+ antiporter NhaA
MSTDTAFALGVLALTQPPLSGPDSRIFVGKLAGIAGASWLLARLSRDRPPAASGCLA